MNWIQVLAFLSTVLVLTMAPGPNFLLITKTVTMSGTSGAFANIAGFASAFVLHGVLSIVGFSAILASSDTLFYGARILGAAYLCFLGASTLKQAIVLIRRQMRTIQSTSISVDITDLPDCADLQRSDYLIQSWREGFITNCLNPKNAIFYLSIFPQFIVAGKNSIASSALLVAIHIVVHSTWFTLVALTIGKLLATAEKAIYLYLINLLSGLALFSIGVICAISASV